MKTLLMGCIATLLTISAYPQLSVGQFVVPHEKVTQDKFTPLEKWKIVFIESTSNFMGNVYYLCNSKLDTVDVSDVQINSSSNPKLIYTESELAKFLKQNGPSAAKKILSGKPWIGMSEAQIVAAWGEPDSKHSIKTKYQNREQWDYTNDYNRLLYFANGKLVAIAD